MLFKITLASAVALLCPVGVHALPDPHPLAFLYWLAYGYLLTVSLRIKGNALLVFGLPTVWVFYHYCTVMAGLMGKTGDRVGWAAQLVLFALWVAFVVLGHGASQLKARSFWAPWIVWLMGLGIYTTLMDGIGLPGRFPSNAMYPGLWGSLVLPYDIGVFFIGTCAWGSLLWVMERKASGLAMWLVLTGAMFIPAKAIFGPGELSQKWHVSMANITSPKNEPVDYQVENALLDEYLEFIQSQPVTKTAPGTRRLLIFPGATLRHLEQLHEAFSRLWKLARERDCEILIYSYNDHPWSGEGHKVYHFAPNEPPIAYPLFHFIPLVENRVSATSALTMPISQGFEKQKEEALCIDDEIGVSICFESMSSSMLRDLAGSKIIVAMGSYRDVRGEKLNAWTRENAIKLSVEHPGTLILVNHSNGWMGVARDGRILAEDSFAKGNPRKRWMEGTYLRYSGN